MKLNLRELYRRLWSKLGGRPWSFIYRDIWHKYEWIPQTIFFVCGVLAGRYLQDTWSIALIWTIYTLGYINGHLHWGDAYVSGQEKERGEK